VRHADAFLLALDTKHGQTVWAKKIADYEGDFMSTPPLTATTLVPETPDMLLKHLDGTLSYCGTKMRFGVVEAIKRQPPYAGQLHTRLQKYVVPLLSAKRMATAHTEYVAVHHVSRDAYTRCSCEFLRRVRQSITPL
jgi:hypothetical protein